MMSKARPGVEAANKAENETMGPRVTIEALRARIRRLERSGPSRAEGLAAAQEAQPPAVPLGMPALDAHLPGGGLRLSGLHEIAGARDAWDDGSAAGFCLALLGRVAAARPRPLTGGVVLWAARRPDLYGPGVAALGFDPGRLVLVRAARDAEVLWALEEGLRVPAFLAVVGEVGEPDDTAARRLQLAAETAGRPCFVLRRRLFAARGAAAANSALTRWRVAALPSATQAPDALIRLPGRTRWRVDLLRCRGAAPRSFTVEWDDAAGGFALAASVRDRTPVSAGAARAAG